MYTRQACRVADESPRVAPKRREGAGLLGLTTDTVAQGRAVWKPLPPIPTTGSYTTLPARRTCTPPSTRTRRTPPDISEPAQIALAPVAQVMLRTMMFSLGCPTRQPSASRPLLIEMQSSPEVMLTFSIKTSTALSGSTPSLLMCGE